MNRINEETKKKKIILRVATSKIPETVTQLEEIKIETRRRHSISLLSF